MQVRLTLIDQVFHPFLASPLRTLLAVLGIVFGVGAVVAMISIGQGAQDEIIQGIEAMGADLLQIEAVTVDEAGLADTINHSRGLNRNDLADLIEIGSNIGVGNLSSSKRITIHSSSLDLDPKALTIFAIDRFFLKVHNKRLYLGRDFDPGDFGQLRNVAVIGYDTAGLIDPADPSRALGQYLRLNHSWWQVIGIIEDTALHLSEKQSSRLPIDPKRFDQSIFIPLDTVFAKLAPPATHNELDSIALKLDSTEQTLSLKGLVEAILRKNHGGADDFKVIAPEELLRQEQDAQEIFNIVLLSIAAISLLVGGIGIMNIMLANVLERVREIGIRRAVGATRTQILTQFLSETIGISLIGGCLGILTGVAIGWAVNYWTEIAVRFSPISIVLSLAISIGIGVFFGILPAHRATTIDPITALRSE